MLKALLFRSVLLTALLVSKLTLPYLALAEGFSKKYGDIVTYAVDEPISYPDFTLTFLGTETKGDIGGVTRMSLYYKFEVSSSRKDVQAYLRLTPEKNVLEEISENGSYTIGGVKYFEGWSKPSKSAQIFWTSGMGEIIETEFKVADKTYLLDLAPRRCGKFVNSGKPDLIVHD